MLRKNCFGKEVWVKTIEDRLEISKIINMPKRDELPAMEITVSDSGIKFLLKDFQDPTLREGSPRSIKWQWETLQFKVFEQVKRNIEDEKRNIGDDKE